MNWFECLKKQSVYLGKWLILSGLIGLSCGVIGGVFSLAITGVTHLRQVQTWLIYLLPLGGLATVAIDRFLSVDEVGTNQVFETVQTGKKSSFWLAPAVFIASILTHMFGGSAGKEGAALQMGGSLSGMIGSAFRLNEQEVKRITVCGMAALFSSAFGTPLGAGIFALEVVCIGSISLSAVFPTLISSFVAYFTAISIGATGECFSLASVPAITASSVAKVGVVALAGGVVSIVFCLALKYGGRMAHRYVPNPYLRAFFGGLLLIALTLVVGTHDYNGSGLHVIANLFHGQIVDGSAFLMKVIFTVITVSTGYKGGEIVPALFIGATLGCVLAGGIGLSPALGAAVGMVSLFCGATNCIWTTIILSVELFGGNGLLYFGIAAAISFVVSGKVSLYSSQTFSRGNMKIQY